MINTRLLLDEQLSEELCTLLAEEFVELLHVRLLGAGGASDRTVWEMARKRGCILVTKDEDFHRLSVLRGAPPKVIWVRLGNCSTSEIAGLLSRRTEEIGMFAEQPEAALLELG